MFLFSPICHRILHLNFTFIFFYVPGPLSNCICGNGSLRDEWVSLSPSSFCPFSFFFVSGNVSGGAADFSSRGGGRRGRKGNERKPEEEEKGGNEPLLHPTSAWDLGDAY